MKFKNFWQDTHEKTISADSFQKRNVILIDKFQILQDRIELLVTNTADEEVHQFREIFETMYFDVITEVHGYS